MAEPVTINLRHVARGLAMPLGQIQAVVELLDEGNTVPFITRYRKDQTGGLDEEPIRQIQARLAKLRLLAERKQTILRSIESQGKLTEKLSKQIRAAGTTKRLEDLYLPYRPKKQTLAALARSRGLEPLAGEILAAEKGCADLDSRAADFVSPEREVPTAADALLGAGHVLAEQFSERAELRQRLREIIHRSGKLVSTRTGGESKAASEKVEKTQKPGGGGHSTAAGQSPQTDLPATRQSAPPSEPQSEQAAEQPSPPSGAEPPPEAQSQEEHPADSQAKVDQTPESPAEVEPTEAAQLDVEPPAEPHAQADASNEAGVRSETTDPSSGEVQQPAEPQAEAGQPAETSAGTEPAAEAQGEQPAPKEPDQPAPRVPAVRQKQVTAEKPLGRRELKKKKAEEMKQKAFADYFDYSEEIKRIPPHRVLAINRGERAKVLRVRVDADLDAMHQALDEFCVPNDHPHAEFLRGCARDALARLILPSLEREVRRDLTERAETHAVGVFARNLRNLLLQPPVRGHRVLAVDPGYRSGCKLAALDPFGNVLAHGVIYLVGKPERRQDAKRIVTELFDHFELTVIAVGNGTACREAEDFFATLLADEIQDRDISYVIVNEAGASVYSTSRLGREEFPDYDASLRGAISIGRRLQDPLSELVKIEPANIGVGLYQHDVKARHLQASLDEVVESCVNYVGVDVNTASPALLRYVSGLNQLTARRLYEHRLENGPFRNREQLREVPGFGEATFIQAAGFLKITGGDNPLDTTWIHPESYEVAGRVMSKLECTSDDLTRKEAAGALAERIGQVEVPPLAKELQVGRLLLRDIVAQLARPGRDPREDLPGPVFKQGVLKLEDLHPGMELTGTVLNVVDFGAFVDIGMHDSGLVHVSQLADKFVRDPHDVIAVGDVVKVWVLEVDKQRRRVSLTMIPPGTKRSGPRRGGKPADARPSGHPEPPPPEGKSKARRPPRFKAKGAAKPRYRPKSRPKPVTPITDEMIAGKEPMRSFSDLAQFFHAKEGDSPKDGKRGKSRTAKRKPPPPKHKPPSAKDEQPVFTPEDKSTPTEAETPKQDVPQAPGDPKPAGDQHQKSQTDSQAPGTDHEPAEAEGRTPKEEPQSRPDDAQAASDPTRSTDP